MRRGNQVICTSCGARVPLEPLCAKCGTPTAAATEEQRITYELERWRRHASEPPKAKPAIGLAERRDGPGSEMHRTIYLDPPRSTPSITPSAGPSSARTTPSFVAPSRNGAPSAEGPRLLDLRKGERVSLTEEGRSGLRQATLAVTQYRVALIVGRHPRWIPLEEVHRVRLTDKVTVSVDAWGESLRFVPTQALGAEALRSKLESEVASARQVNSPRHHPDLLQEWCERSSRQWRSTVGRMRVRLRPSVDGR